jgi:hypothetical protein
LDPGHGRVQRVGRDYSEPSRTPPKSPVATPAPPPLNAPFPSFPLDANVRGRAHHIRSGRPPAKTSEVHALRAKNSCYCECLQHPARHQSASKLQLDIRMPRRGRVSNYNQADAWSICLDAQNSISVNGLLIDLAYLCRLVPEDLHYLPSFSLVTDLFLN